MSIEPVQPAYQWGMRMIALDDLCNDGSFTERGENDWLAGAGTVCEIVDVGEVVKSGNCVVGCTKNETAPAVDGLLAEEGAVS
ncbi:hypothetical protein LMG28727_07319 [Paraburkholderia kirstenboschensis]|uniref:nitrogen fixation protein NifZ n=1 Tax=Paraburkholderia kirstenboschensis TaxID=1245436 RepID=UPI000A9DE30F|nr:nitrogen fixation protein NifZ [Paraburkholderia kirstenboschensis]CAD6561034.1 hypothetical protein LMG28727_07319 [Paraburkholderia kirstenboschensis]